jgi:hypothetical protein
LGKLLPPLPPITVKVADVTPAGTIQVFGVAVLYKIDKGV